MQEFKAIFYKKTDGTEPAKEFLKSLDRKTRAEMIWLIAMLESKGTKLREPYSKHLKDGIFELWVKVVKDISRVLYFFIVKRRVIFTHGILKKTDITPLSEINKAKL